MLHFISNVIICVMKKSLKDFKNPAFLIFFTYIFLYNIISGFFLLPMYKILRTPLRRSVSDVGMVSRQHAQSGINHLAYKIISLRDKITSHRLRRRAVTLCVINFKIEGILMCFASGEWLAEESMLQV